MQNKGLVTVVAVLLTLVCIFYLSFSAATSYYDGKAAEIKDPIAQQNYKDSVKYLGVYSYHDCLETQIGLGLDLKGGMNVILEISVPDVVETLADHKTDAEFVTSMKEAKKNEETSQDDFVTLFYDAWKKNAKGKKLSAIFATQQLKGKVSTQSTDDQVIAVIRESVQEAIDNSYNVVRQRIDKFGVVQPNIQKLEGEDGRIMVEMPGVKEPERVRKLLQGSANLEFWETYTSDEAINYLNQLSSRWASGGEAAEDTTATEANKEVAQAAEGDSAKADSSKADAKLDLGKADKKDADQNAAFEEAKKKNPLVALSMSPGGLSVVGLASARDTAIINKVIYSDLAKQILPSDMKLLWSAKPADYVTGTSVYELHALRITQANGRAPLEGDVVTNAEDKFDQVTNKPTVSMTMNSEGARRWAALTKANIGKAIAIVLDDAVYSAPRVNGEIPGGQSEISGNFTIQDTKDLSNTLKSGRMPAPARIVQEEVVGPTLGAQSIQQGIISFIVAFVVLMFYMVLMYGFKPGMLANSALLVNLFFTLGILCSFQAALTMPGIAGIVLTLGMAVDANVLIYERIKEELRNGKNVKEAVQLGYNNAFSAIFDSNVTSLITGFILFFIGTGPVKGFAWTYIIGIVCSFFTAVFLTRMIYESRLAKDKWLDLTFVTGFSKNFMQNAKFRFMGIYKKSFTVAAVAALAFIVCFFVKGLSTSIDFTGGRNYVVAFEKAVEPEQIRPILAEAYPEASTSALAIGTDGKTVRISTNYMIESNDPTIDDKCEQILYDALKKGGFVTQGSIDEFKNPDVREGGSIISSTKVGPSIAKDITHKAIISVLVALIFIFVYIMVRFNSWRFSLGAIVALALDTLVVIGMYSALWGIVPFSLEIDQVFIGAILTVVGYSINDKVVVFDRIRENLKLHPKRDLQQNFNNSLNETLARTINTSVSTLLVLLCIFILGGDSIRSFSFAMILGVVFGTCSSIFIAAPVAYLTLGKSIKEAGLNEAVEEEK
ncbi:MAG: protein translocase subunit SecDF [Bacteroidaceae bacterium]|nr:protein translocase subunit SecDF [Bacteroidaceae bacterium]